MTSYATSSARAEMSELRRLKTLLPPELQSWVMVEGSVRFVGYKSFPVRN